MGQDSTVVLNGTLSAGHATGDVAYGATRRHLDHAAVSIDGDLRARFAPAVQVPLRALASGVEPIATLAGTATDVDVGGEPLRAPAPPHVAAETGTWVASALAIVLVFHRFLVVPLYSRVSLDRVLGNANRARLLASLRERPGLTVRELREASGLSRIVVEHHLTMLAAHRLVRKTAMGRANRYYATDAPLDEEALEASLALLDATRRAVAEVVARRGDATQRDLMETTGLSQRLVSYHLARLSRTRLVLVHEGAPLRYRPTPLLLERLAQAA
jgi:predicted transcriptional regulator